MTVVVKATSNNIVCRDKDKSPRETKFSRVIVPLIVNMVLLHSHNRYANKLGEGVYCYATPHQTRGA